MASSNTQAKAQALNQKLENEAQATLDSIEKSYLRSLAKKSYQAAVQCYDKAGTTGSAQTLEVCVKNSQLPYHQANDYVQQEVNLYQSRLNHAMQECQNKARDAMVAGYEKDAKKMQKIENVLLECMESTVNEYIQMLKPMKERIASQLKQIK